MGDKVSPGDELCGIETDKAVVGFEMQEEGYVAKVLYGDGAKDIDLGLPIAVLVDDEDDIAAFADWSPDAGDDDADDEDDEEPAQQQAAAPTKAAGAKVARQAGDRIVASPLARKTAEAKGVDLSTVQGTGPRDRIILADVEDALKAGPVKVAKDVEVKKVAKPAAAAEAKPAPQRVDMPDDLFQDIKVS